MALKRTTYPIDFSVNTEGKEGDYSPVIYIENLDNAHNLLWGIVNVGSDEKFIQKLDGEPSIDNYHFQLKFRPGTLAQEFINQSEHSFSVNTTEGVKWKISVDQDQNDNNITYISLLASEIPENLLVLKPQKSLLVTIDKVAADPVGGARNTNVEMRYNHILNSDNQENILTGTRMQHLGIINHDGIRNIPFLAEIKGSNTILNDGSTNILSVQVFNFGKKDIKFSTKAHEPSYVEIVIRAPEDHENGELFLAKLDNLSKIELTREKDLLDYWNPPVPYRGEDFIAWSVTNNNQKSLKSGESLYFKLSNIVTNLPEGIANIQINYYNIDGYWDGNLQLDIVKGPLVYRERKVGIGTNTPKELLHVKAEETIAQFESSTNESSIKLSSAEATGGSIGLARRQGGKAALWVSEGGDAITVLKDGKVGIGSGIPKAKFEVYGVALDGTRGRNHFKDIEKNDGKGLRVGGIWGRYGIYAENNMVEIGGQEGVSLQNKKVIVDNNGKVGIGTTQPSHLFHVKAGDAVGMFESTGGQAYLRLSTKEGIDKRVEFANRPGGRAALWVGGRDVLNIVREGRVGIGTENPTKAKLEVNGSVSQDIGYHNSVNRYKAGVWNFWDSKNPVDLSIYATNNIAAQEIDVFSDARIKNIIGRSNQVEDLNTLLQIEITDYTYKDALRGNRPQKKVVGQQLAEAYPQAVSTHHTDVLPDIMQKAQMVVGEVTLPLHNLKTDERVQLIFEDDSKEVYTIRNVTKDSFTIETECSGEVFIYGREVNDFHIVDIEALSTLNISASQALHQQITNLKDEVGLLKKENQTLRKELHELKQMKTEMREIRTLLTNKD